MNPTDNQQLHLSLLLVLAACGEIGIQEAHLLPRLRLEFRDLTAPELTSGLRSLADRRFALSHQPSIGAARWKILSLGTAALQEAGLA